MSLSRHSEPEVVDNSRHFGVKESLYLNSWATVEESSKTISSAMMESYCRRIINDNIFVTGVLVLGVMQIKCKFDFFSAAFYFI